MPTTATHTAASKTSTATHTAASKSSTAARIANAVTAILTVAVIVIALMLVAGKPLGFHAFAVQSGSMEPAYSTGDLIYVKSVDPESIAEGDVITYLVSGDSVVTHRVIEVVQDADNPSITGFRTQGDANATPDGGIVHEDNLIGTPILAIPLVGYVAGFIQTPPGTYIALAVCALVVFLVFLPDLFSKDEEEEAEKTSAKEPRANHGQSSMAAPANRQLMAPPANRSHGAMPQGRAYGQAAYAQAAAGPRPPRPQAQSGYQRQHPAQSVRPVARQAAVPVYPGATTRTSAAQHPGATSRSRAAQHPNASRAANQHPDASRAANQHPSANAAYTHHAPARGGANNPRLAKAQARPSATGMQPAAAANKPAAANARPRGVR